jgi:hypothetical protein
MQPSNQRWPDDGLFGYAVYAVGIVGGPRGSVIVFLAAAAAAVCCSKRQLQWVDLT